MTTTGYAHIVRDQAGVLRVHDGWFKVIMLVGEHVYRGDDAATLAAEHPPLTLGAAHSVLAYYYDHKHELDAELARREREAEALREAIVAAQSPSPLRERLRAAVRPVHDQRA